MTVSDIAMYRVPLTESHDTIAVSAKHICAGWSCPTLFIKRYMVVNIRIRPGLLTFSQTSPCFHMSAGQVYWKHNGKRRNCSWRAISAFPTVFSTFLENSQPFLSNLKLSFANSFSLEQSIICCLGKYYWLFTERQNSKLVQAGLSWSPAFSPFPIMFTKGFIFMVVKIRYFSDNILLNESWKK